ncbi:MAG TPA: MltA domain-containing protein [Parvibaculum sp.]
MGRRGIAFTAGIGFVLLTLAGCSTSEASGMAGAIETVGLQTALDFNDLDGWSNAGQALTLSAFRRSCARILQLNQDAPLDPKTANSFYGEAADWREACRAAADVGPGDSEARAYFERYFAPVRLSNETTKSLFTGYYEPEMKGALHRGGVYQTPILKIPPAFAATRKPWPTRGEIEDMIASGELDASNLALVWLADPVDAFFLHVQGSGRVALEDGTTFRLAFAAKNERPYTSIGKLLIADGAIPRDEVSMQTIRAWLEEHPDKVRPLLRRNDSYIFFKELKADHALGSLGAEGVNLTPRRSLAVDRSLHPLGALFWLDTTSPVPHGEGSEAFRHLMVAQDTGTAIRGLQRGDIFWGPGSEAAEIAGRMKQPGELIALLPRALVSRR